MAAQDTPVTELLAALGRGDVAAGDQLLPIVYRELRAIAGRKMAGERAGHTLTPTALVHETWLKLIGSSTPVFQDRRHFLAIAAIAMRRVLIDHARGAARDKRGQGWVAVTLDGSLGELADTAADPADLLALDAALERLDALDASMARVVELRYFGGLTVEEAAEVLDMSPRSVNRAWTAARAWLGRELRLG
jgi:RNA polymerase sigma-70 factor, ECF subfamily